MKLEKPAAGRQLDLDLTDDEVAALRNGDQEELKRIRLRVAMGLWRRVRQERRSLEAVVAMSTHRETMVTTAASALVDAYEDAALQRIFAFLLETVWAAKDVR